MPFVTIALGGPGVSAQTIAALQRRMTDLMVSIMGKRREVTAVRVDTHDGATWSIGGAPPAGRAAHVEVAVTRGTNTAEEVAALIAATMDMLKEVAGVTEAASYVIVRPLPADHWGYDGQTQAARSAARRSG